MGSTWGMLFSDAAGNDERMAKVLEEIGEIAVPPKDLPNVTGGDPAIPRCTK
jgi:hypothetical protein